MKNTFQTNIYIYIPTYKEGEKTVYIHAAEKEEI